MVSYEQVMIEKGLKQTKQRALVFDVLLKADRPLEVEQIYKMLFKESINLSTVYRILEIFLANDIVIKTMFGHVGTSAYEINRKEHKHHLLCVKCRKIIAISGCPLQKYVEELQKETDYQIIEHRLEILGICPECQKEKTSH